MARKIVGGILALILCWASNALATSVSFAGLTNVPFSNPGSNGEVDGTEWLADGLLLTSPTLALNVGCGTPAACLGADLNSISDFNGIINGFFVIPGTLTPASVFSLGIEFCCEDIDRPVGFDDLTTTSIFNTSGALIAQFFDVDFFFASSVPIGSFSIDFGSDAMSGIRFNEVPEPASWALMLIGLLSAFAFFPKRKNIRDC